MYMYGPTRLDFIMISEFLTSVPRINMDSMIWGEKTVEPMILRYHRQINASYEETKWQFSLKCIFPINILCEYI